MTHEGEHLIGDEARPRPAELLADRAQPLQIIGTGRLEPTHDELVERLLQGEQRTGDLRVRTHSA